MHNRPFFLLAAALLFGASASTQSQWTQWPATNGGNDHWYLAVYVPGGVDWSTADQQAQAMGGHLVSITSAAENSFVYGLLADTAFWQPQSNPTRLYGPWIGGFQPPGSSEPNGSWSWRNGDAWTYSHWAPSEPNQYGGVEEDNAHFYTLGSTTQQTWNDAPPDLVLQGFVVESALAPPASYAVLGVGCAPAGDSPPTLEPVAGALPALGTVSHLRLASCPSNTQFVVLAFGTSNMRVPTATGSVLLPISLGPLGWLGCNLLVSLDATGLYLATSPFIDFGVVIPPDPALVRARFFHQALVATTGDVLLTASVAGSVGP